MRTRYERRVARMEGIVKAVALAVLLVTLLITLSVTGLNDEPPEETDARAQFAAQEEYYRVMELYGDEEGAVEAARIVFEREVNQ